MNSSPRFAEIKAILDKAIDGWRNRTHRNPDLSVHSGNFGWSTKSALQNATAFNLRLIDPALVGNGHGSQTNLVVALQIGVKDGPRQYPRMPRGGPYLSDDDIQKIVVWIDAGMPD